ncbi:CAF17-like 4Fe-4S cluster assembly/insertion protein YgfZ [Stratiformator vulcanicus]|uniref:Dimethylsulfonioproprionate demethylase DmdA n=1 Tax=Stratiformator vulcanicus TaxID=2527980 RepID=A0A517R4B6_9PLAN|nr:glycine cleavage T C-terminal barrel domain-containing protein [Stratiformator vulcanicus]QDT38735.1 Dimethylsulfonioproprionate demethylase DmdA [Stratiformator vulcanicus]
MLDANQDGSPVDGVDCAQDHTLLFDFPNRTQLRLTGDDRAKLLQNLCSNDVSKLQPGQGCEAFLTNVKARVLGHIFVYAAADELWIDSAPGQEDALFEHLDRYVITEDVTIERMTESRGDLLLVGPQAESLLTQCDLMPAELEIGHHATLSDEHHTQVRCTGWLKQPTFVISSGTAGCAAIRGRLTEAGANDGDPKVWDILRIEALFPEFGRDITEDRLAPEVGRNDLAISYTKGCYLGQEPIARIKALGHVNRELRGLLIEGQYDELADAPILADGKEIGRVTSFVAVPGENRTVALGYLRMKWAGPGTTVEIGDQTQAIAAKVFANE